MKFFAQKLPLFKGHLGPKGTNCALPPGPPRIQTPLNHGSSHLPFPLPACKSFQVPLVLPLSYCLLFHGAPIFPFCSKGCSCDCSLMHGCGCTFPSGDSRPLESNGGRDSPVMPQHSAWGRGNLAVQEDNTCIPFVCSCQNKEACPQSPFNSTSQKFGVSEDPE